MSVGFSKKEEDGGFIIEINRYCLQDKKRFDKLDRINSIGPTKTTRQSTPVTEIF